MVGGSLAHYTPFGGYRTGGPNPLTDRGFTGQRGDMDLGLYYYNARYYLPGAGRFLSADTLVPDPQNPQALNRYAYVLNRPLNFSDPTGHDAQCWASDGNDIPSYTNCDTWMENAIEILKNSGGIDGTRLAQLYESWANDPNKMLLIYAYGDNRSNMFTRFHSSDEVAIYMGWEVTTTYRRNEIALLGHELEHVDQGTLQA
ncbi:MAG TPA: RHS repeat-associated core domain-containing protein [Chloroflexi bacterium]|nr:RHS repeat-associated core domain-containing protein [Chloroflexota bacterium]